MDELDRQQNHRRLSGVLREQLNLHRGACGARCEVQALTLPTTDIAIFRGLLYPARPISVIASRSIMSLPTRRRSLDATLFGDMGGKASTPLRIGASVVTTTMTAAYRSGFRRAQPGTFDERRHCRQVSMLTAREVAFSRNADLRGKLEIKIS